MNESTVVALHQSFLQYEKIIEELQKAEGAMHSEFDASVYGFEHQEHFYKSEKQLRKSIKNLQKGMNEIYDMLPKHVQKQIAGV